MLPLIIIASVASITVLLTLVFRTNAATVFMAVTAGIVLFEYFGPDARLVLDAAAPRGSSVLPSVLNISLICLPAAVTIVMLRKKAKGVKFVLGIVPAACAGLLLVLAVIPQISPLTRNNVMDTWAWKNLYDFRGLVVGLGVFTSLLMLKPSKKHEGSGKKHK